MDAGSAPVLTNVHGGITDRACKTCRVRKVKCDRHWPTCARCAARGDDCDFKTLLPLPDATDSRDDPRILHLEQRMANLETNLSILREQTGTPAAAFSTLADSPEAEEILQMSLSSPRAGGLSTTLEEGLARANTFPEQIRATFLNGAADPAKLYNFLLANSTFGIFESDYDTESRRGIIPAGGLTLGRTFGPGYNQIGERSLDWRLAMPALSKALSLHLLSTFFQSCCSYLRVFDEFHPKLEYFRQNIMDLDPASQVAVAAFCAMGARASPHSALLGIAVQDPEGAPSIDSVVAAGTRRETACRGLSERAMSLYQKSQIGDDPSIENLEVTLAMMQMLIFAELAPRRSRSMALTALNHFKDLQHSINPASPPSESSHLFALGLPIFICDAVISAYARKPSLISQADLDTYFTSTELFRPDFSKDVLDEILTRWLTVSPGSREDKDGEGEKDGGGEENGIDESGDGRGNTSAMGLDRNPTPSSTADQPMRDSRTRENGGTGPQLLGRHGNPISRTTVDGIIDLEEEEKAEETVTHASLSKCTTILCCWLGEVQREFARVSSPKSVSTIPLSVEIYGLWSAIDQVHSAVQRIQQLLVNLEYTPPGCAAKDGCENLHLRYDTRLDRDLFDVIYLIHALILAKVGLVGSESWDALTRGIMVESEARVRRSLKLIAFYSQLYITSRDRHMVYHVFWQLELLPNWPDLALARFGEAGGPGDVGLEVTETELDWFVKGLRVAAFYHPVAEARLQEFKSKRRPPRQHGTHSSAANTTTTDSNSHGSFRT